MKKDFNHEQHHGDNPEHPNQEEDEEEEACENNNKHTASWIIAPTQSSEADNGEHMGNSYHHVQGRPRQPRVTTETRAGNSDTILGGKYGIAPNVAINYLHKQHEEQHRT